MSTQSATILLVEDDKTIARVVEPALTQAGYSVRWAQTADQAFGFMTGGVIDAVLLDRDLPGISGIELIKIVRNTPSVARVPIIMMTVHGKEADKVSGLMTGADDYMVKPFSVKELLARVAAQLRRSRFDGVPQDLIEAGGVRIDLRTRQVSAGAASLELTPMEFDLLTRLAERRGVVLTYQAISETLSEGSKILNSENIHNHVKNLRRKLGAHADVLETVHGIGYRFRAK
ncbi:MAG: response regulator transcription factor [Elusimicrobia bacterium]|nr:response regulator transcription factor [Elusimicrobiota bacterium]